MSRPESVRLRQVARRVAKAIAPAAATVDRDACLPHERGAASRGAVHPQARP
jgi:hypothetical protein